MSTWNPRWLGSTGSCSFPGRRECTKCLAHTDLPRRKRCDCLLRSRNHSFYLKAQHSSGTKRGADTCTAKHDEMHDIAYWNWWQKTRTHEEPKPKRTSISRPWRKEAVLLHIRLRVYHLCYCGKGWDTFGPHIKACQFCEQELMSVNLRFRVHHIINLLEVISWKCVWTSREVKFLLQIK